MMKEVPIPRPIQATGRFLVSGLEGELSEERQCLRAAIRRAYSPLIGLLSH